MPRLPSALARTPVALLGLGLVVGMVALAVAAPWLAPHDPLQVQLGPANSAPSADFWLGTDGVGRDCLSRLLHGARVSLPIGLLAVIVAAGLGTLLGALAGYLGGAVDRVISWVSDLFLALPRLVLLLAVLAVAARAQEGRFLLVALVLGLTGWMPVVRIVRAQVQSLRDRAWVLAARSQGLPWWRILFRHVLPAALPPVMVHASLLVGTTILAEAALSFLGLGVPAPTPTWGNMIAEGMQRLDAWWLTVFPGLAITAAVAGFNLLGDGLRDILAHQGEDAP